MKEDHSSIYENGLINHRIVGSMVLLAERINGQAAFQIFGYLCI
jgi:hypothetical protein